MTAEFEDSDTPVTQLQWQWYRAQETSPTGRMCAGRTPSPDDSDAHRVFIADTNEATVGGEQVEQITIPDGAVLGHRSLVQREPATLPDTRRRLTTEDTLTDVGRCLRATFTYRDHVDRTHSEADDAGTDVDETLEGTFGGSLNSR